MRSLDSQSLDEAGRVVRLIGEITNLLGILGLAATRRVPRGDAKFIRGFIKLGSPNPAVSQGALKEPEWVLFPF